MWSTRQVVNGSDTELEDVSNTPAKRQRTLQADLAIGNVDVTVTKFPAGCKSGEVEVTIRNIGSAIDVTVDLACRYDSSNNSVSVDEPPVERSGLVGRINEADAHAQAPLETHDSAIS